MTMGHMKYAVIILALFLTFLAGYVVEPMMRGILVAPPRVEEPAAVPEPFVPEAPPDPGPQPQPEPEPEPEPELEPEPEPEPEPDPLPAAPTDNEIRQVMYQSIQRAEIDRFTIGQVSEWKEFGEEEIDGVTYQFGLLEYREPTLFGEREREAKALIRDGKVEKWIWTSNGLRIP